MHGYDCIDGNCQCRYCHVTQPCTDFTPAATPRGHTLQCRTCNTAARHRKLGTTPRQWTPDHTCQWCGATFHPDHNNRARYCSRPCRYAADRKPDACPVYYANCTRCGTLFTSQTAARKVCGAGKCDVLRHRVTDRCPDCGNERQFLQTYCDPCRALRLRAAQKRAKRKRRAVHRHVLADTVDPRTVYDRDHWMCGICRKAVDPSLTHPNPMSASLDHVIPIAMGGSHTYLNTQLAHLQCNLNKSANPPVVKGKVRRDQVLF